MWVNDDWWKHQNFISRPLNYENFVKERFKLDLVDVVNTQLEEDIDYAYDNYLIELGAQDIE